MHRQFKQKPYWEADRRYNSRHAGEAPPVPEPYRLSFISSIAGKYSDLFYITFFKNNPGEGPITEALGRVFGGSLLRVVRVGAWFYEVQLVSRIPWGEIKERVAEALKGLCPGVSG